MYRKTFNFYRGIGYFAMCNTILSSATPGKPFFGEVIWVDYKAYGSKGSRKRYDTIPLSGALKCT